MATGRNIQLTKQVGEYLVAAELGLRGFLATTFTGNVPEYDIVASSEAGRTLLIQVKTINAGTWQFDIRRFAEFQLNGKKQKYLRMKEPPISSLVCVFVLLSKEKHRRFFICTWQQFQKILINEYRKYLQKHNGVRPKKHDSFHSSLNHIDIARYEDNWDLIKRKLK